MRNKKFIITTTNPTGFEVGDIVTFNKGKQMTRKRKYTKKNGKWTWKYIKPKSTPEAKPLSLEDYSDKILEPMIMEEAAKYDLPKADKPSYFPITIKICETQEYVMINYAEQMPRNKAFVIVATQ